MVQAELWLIVGTYCIYNDADNNDTEWLLTAGVDMDYDTARALLLKHIRTDVEEGIDVEDIQIDDVWYNRYTEVDGFDITLTEKEDN